MSASELRDDTPVTRGELFDLIQRSQRTGRHGERYVDADKLREGLRRLKRKDDLADDIGEDRRDDEDEDE